MRKWLLVLGLLFISGPCRAQVQLTVTGLVTDPSGNPATSGYVQFTLTPAAGAVLYRVSGTSALVPAQAQCGINGSGHVMSLANLALPCKIWGNDNITPANSAYNVTFAPNGQVTQTIPNELFQGAGPVDLSQPIFAPQVQVNPQYAVIYSSPFQTNIIPAADQLFNIGAAGRAYNTIYTYNLVINNSFAVLGTQTANLFQSKTCINLQGGSGNTSDYIAVCSSAPGAAYTATLPNNTGTVAELNLGQSWSATQTFGTAIFTTLQSSTTHFAGSGSIRLAAADLTCYRNVANSADLCLGPNLVDGLDWNNASLPQMYTHAGALVGRFTGVTHIVSDTVTLAGGTATVALTSPAAFTSNTTFSCWANDTTTPSNAVTITLTSGASITFAGTGVDVLTYGCLGS
jgi:hypothetical protein